MRATVRSAASAAAAIAAASSGVRSASARRASVPSASAAATSRAGPPLEAASAGSRPRCPYRRRSAPKPTGPSPWTPARTAQASRSSIPGVDGAVGPCAGVRASSAWCEAAPIGPSTPTPSISAPRRRRAARRPADTRPPRRGGRARPPRRRRGRRSSGRRAAAAPCRGRWLVRARASDHDPPFRARPQAARLAQSPAGEPAVERAARPVRRDATRGRDPGGDDGRALRVRPANERHRRDARHRDPQVDPVAERAGDASLVALRHAASGRRSGRSDVPAKPHGHGFIAATSWNRAGKVVARPARDDRHAAFLERLAERLEDVAVELGQLVEEQHALVGAG